MIFVFFGDYPSFVCAGAGYNESTISVINAYIYQMGLQQGSYSYSTAVV
ncbi:hypothetical protein [Paenibacillus sp. PastF-1]|nr:ABC-type polysaccharide transport system permease subunit [Paenibacillus sp. PastF-2]MDF9849616.1 ABC-type polysaccharide transport system permease subunit [Paenibacillus sp. PastM-2]MDF9856467.1 ABC-type polysaccharide transport system permease subunit [Paenibacillus sp. PastF-1]MDH6481738.1 ABC-type polysaccharide transport system permease subunit [Paenibacillus sp. PastH-2]MDH6509019.1 ABC-type polysaccharide transport system permease subunit [Paenibacillus sp. PastM-3]